MSNVNNNENSRNNEKVHTTAMNSGLEIMGFSSSHLDKNIEIVVT